MAQTLFDEKQHCGGVRSRTDDSCVVDEPVIVEIDGQSIPLSLMDAYSLCMGLISATARIRASQAKLINESTSHAPIIGKTNQGMCGPRSKLGDGEFGFLHSYQDIQIANKLGLHAVFASADIDAYQAKSPNAELSSAVLSNCSIRIPLKDE